jgi:transposase
MTLHGRSVTIGGPGVEGTLSQGGRAFGMRQSRYVGLAKTALQQICIAIGMNISRVVHWLDGLPRAKTRVTRFAPFAQTA